MPLLKWAGGKRQLRSELVRRLPNHWGTYYEPFIGGGALLVELANTGRLTKGVIGDKNPELVSLYRVVKNDPYALIRALSDDKFKNDEESFRHLKAEFNTLIGTRKSPVNRAALLLYLNKHSYNGLWRVNSRGHYNVPFGKYPRLSLPSAQDILIFSRMLRNVTLVHADFERILRTVKEGDFVYLDPPYHPLSKTARFTDYTTGGFPFEDQKRLARVFGRLSDRGVLLMLSNSCTPEIRALYDGYTIHTVPAKRFINCKGERRGGAVEVIVTNY
ncbi:MAG: DNA adenine methylase [Methanoregula sp. PtaU1.Bin006]|nr:MAG: DNA adenine methylase [Methanoregula sp. PtaB.Bin085]OPY35241.1 MAG: DNA adenine methylase [Methanoregula sp. PtaU1.Bin006]